MKKGRNEMAEGNLHSTLSACIFLLLSFSFAWLADTQLSLSSLPGFPGPLPFHLETGYVGVGKSDQDQLFYYFVESETNPREDPLLLWLTGGPGCSAWSGLVFEIGPLRFENAEYNGSLPTLLFNPYSWTKVASIIFLDSPTGTGFSYSKYPNDGNGDFKSCREVHEFLRKWLKYHPQFLSNPLYIGGDSYSGITVPILAQEIANAIEDGQKPLINLKGYIVGNPGTDSKFDGNARVPHAHGLGIIPDELYELARTSCNGDYLYPSGEECLNALLEVNKCMMGLNKAHILEPACFWEKSNLKASFENKRSLEEKERDLISQPTLASECRAYGYLLSYYWANDDNVRKALGIHKGSIKDWIRCNYDLPYTKEVQGVLPYHFNLTSKGYRALVYSGDHDLLVPHIGTQAWIRSLNFSVVDDWRSWSVDGQVAGYTEAYAKNLTFATIKGAGHTAPEYKPKEALAMLKRWVSHQPL